MRRLCSFLVCSLTLAVVVSGLPAPSADAYPDFYKAFEKKYVGDKSTDPQKSLAETISGMKSKCNLCHDPAKINGKTSKKNKNPYGKELSELLGKDDKKNEEKIMKALAEVEDKKAENAKASYGDALKAGKVPFEIEGG